MSFRSWFRKTVKLPAKARPAFEVLEDRLAPSVSPLTGPLPTPASAALAEKAYAPLSVSTTAPTAINPAVGKWFYGQ